MEVGEPISAAVEPDRRVFCAFALLNACGYNAESGWQFGTTRRSVRVHLAGRNVFWRSMLEESGLGDVALRGNGALLMDTLPFLQADFSTPLLTETPLAKWQRASHQMLPRFGHVLREFARLENLDAMWEVHRAAHEQQAQTIAQVLGDLRTLARRLTETPLHVTVVPNLLDIQGRGYSVSTERRTWLYVGPVTDAEHARHLLTHEILHRALDPLAEQLLLSAGADPMPRARAMFRIVAESYPECAIWLAETVVRGCTLVLCPDFAESRATSTDALLSQYEQIGFVGVTQAHDYLRSLPAHDPLVPALSRAAELVREQIEVMDARDLGEGHG